MSAIETARLPLRRRAPSPPQAAPTQSNTVLGKFQYSKYMPGSFTRVVIVLAGAPKR
jgi:hypothetical protein